LQPSDREGSVKRVHKLAVYPIDNALIKMVESMRCAIAQRFSFFGARNKTALVATEPLHHRHVWCEPKSLPSRTVSISQHPTYRDFQVG
jgi:hypothetical protein